MNTNKLAYILLKTAVTRGDNQMTDTEREELVEATIVYGEALIRLYTRTLEVNCSDAAFVARLVNAEFSAIESLLRDCTWPVEDYNSRWARLTAVMSELEAIGYVR